MALSSSVEVLEQKENRGRGSFLDFHGRIIPSALKEASENPNILDYLKENKIDLAINVPMGNKLKSYSDVLTDGYIIRRKAVEFNVPVITNLELASALVEVLKQKEFDGLSIRSLNEYMDELLWKLW